MKGDITTVNNVKSRLAALKEARSINELDNKCFDELDPISQSLVECAVELANLNTPEKKTAYLEANQFLSMDALEELIKQFVYDLPIPLAWTKRKDGSSIVKSPKSDGNPAK